MHIINASNRLALFLENFPYFLTNCQFRFKKKPKQIVNIVFLNQILKNAALERTFDAQSKRTCRRKHARIKY